MNEHKKLFLLVFDFDRTIIDNNTDGVVIRKLEQMAGRPHMEQEGEGWSKTMTNCLQQLQQRKVGKDDIEKLICDIPLTPGFTDVFSALRTLNKDVFDCFLLSHSNSYFIHLLLQKYQVKDLFHTVYTYQCKWKAAQEHLDQVERLEVSPHDDPPNRCDICPNDFCKGDFMDNHIDAMAQNENLQYKTVVYVGDGSADYCAALHLRNQSDVVLVRKDHAMHRRLETSQGSGMKAKVVLWENGTEVANYISQLVQREN